MRVQDVLPNDYDGQNLAPRRVSPIHSRGTTAVTPAAIPLSHGLIPLIRHREAGPHAESFAPCKCLSLSQRDNCTDLPGHELRQCCGDHQHPFD